MRLTPDTIRYNRTIAVICSFLPKKKGTLGAQTGNIMEHYPCAKRHIKLLPMSNMLDTMLVRDTQRYVRNWSHNFLWYVRHATIRHATLR